MTATFHVGDAIEVMSKLPEKSVDLILTSPPFLALRSYLPADHESKHLEGGSQATPGAFIDWLIDVVEACDRVLAPHGSLCIELGDTYAGSGGAGGDYAENGLREGQPTWKAATGYDNKFGGTVQNRTAGGGGRGWPLAKSLSLIPELFRLTLVYGTNPLTGRTTDRWRLRNVVRWVRPNPPVGALGDKFRPATSELMVFCKSAKRYFDLDAVRSVNHADRMTEPSMKSPYNKTLGNHTGDGEWHPAGAPPLDWWNIPPGGYVISLDGEEQPYGPKPPEHRMSSGGGSAISDGVPRGVKGDLQSNPGGAPPLDWWEIPPGGYGGAHYAVFPPELCVKPIKAMCPEKVCRQCGEPSRRIVTSESVYSDGTPISAEHARQRRGLDVRSESYGHGNSKWRKVLDESWTDCGHDDWRPGVVLDPFGGSGTTALVATGHGRDAILIDLDERNYELALQRVGPFILERAS